MPAMKYVTLGEKHAKHGIVFLHGWKMNGPSMRGCIRSLLGDTSIPETIFYFITAPLTVDGDGEQPEWFSYTTSDKLTFCATDLIRTRQRLLQLVQRLRVRHNRRGGKLHLAGYSQGACTALDVALSMPNMPIKVLLYAGFCMLPKYVTSSEGWHGYPASTLAKAKLKMWVYHGKSDTEVSWGLARRSYEMLRDAGPGIKLHRVELTDDDHWSMWETDEAAAVLKAFCGMDAEEEGGGDEDETPVCWWDWSDLSEEHRAHAATLGYDEGMRRERNSTVPLPLLRASVASAPH